jgi:hypothetical protein
VIKTAGLRIRTACQQWDVAESDGLLPIMMPHTLHMAQLPSRCFGSITCPKADCCVISARFSHDITGCPSIRHEEYYLGCDTLHSGDILM